MNPAVSLMLHLKGGEGALDQEETAVYAFTQIIAGMSAALVTGMLSAIPSDSHKLSGFAPTRYIAECLGTIIFFTGILHNGGNMFVVGLSLYVAANIVGGVSGGHLNPAVTIMMLFRQKIDFINAVFYIGAQCAGAFLTLELHKRLHA